MVVVIEDENGVEEFPGINAGVNSWRVVELVRFMY
jgi:hypothetical protein